MENWAKTQLDIELGDHPLMNELAETGAAAGGMLVVEEDPISDGWRFLDYSANYASPGFVDRLGCARTAVRYYLLYQAATKKAE